MIGIQIKDKIQEHSIPRSVQTIWSCAAAHAQRKQIDLHNFNKILNYSINYPGLLSKVSLYATPRRLRHMPTFHSPHHILVKCNCSVPRTHRIVDSLTNIINIFEPNPVRFKREVAKLQL